MPKAVFALMSLVACASGSDVHPDMLPTHDECSAENADMPQCQLDLVQKKVAALVSSSRGGKDEQGAPDEACDETAFGDGSAYRGCQTSTVDGKTCQQWSAQSPQSHENSPENKPDAGLDGNYCRNPDGESQIWCYTTDPSERWAHCDPLEQVTEAKLVVTLSESSKCPSGSERIGQVSSLSGDLNQGSEGKYIYLCKQAATTGVWIAELMLSESSTCPATFERVYQVSSLSGDLNQGAGGKDIFLCKHMATSGAYISDVMLSESSTCPSGFTRTPQAPTLNGDLNQGAGGKDIYLCQKKEAPVTAAVYGDPHSVGFDTGRQDDAA